MWFESSLNQPMQATTRLLPVLALPTDHVVNTTMIAWPLDIIIIFVSDVLHFNPFVREHNLLLAMLKTWPLHVFVHEGVKIMPAMLTRYPCA